MKKTFFCCVMMLMSVLSSFSQNTDWYYLNPDSKQYSLGSTEDYKGFVYLIQNEITDFKGAIVSLECDLDMQSYSAAPKLDCTFKGNGHTVTNRRCALFSEISKSGSVEDLIFDSSCGITNAVDVGMVSVKNYGTIKYCESSANISVSIFNEYGHIGGITAYNYGSIIGCKNKGKISVIQGSYYRTVQRVGGISAFNQSGMIAGCSNEGSVTLTTKYYGIGGGITGDLQQSKVVSCVNTGDVTVKLADSSGILESDIILYAGGITGQAQVDSSIDQCVNKGSIISNAQYVGGIAGQVSHTSLSNLINYGDVESVESSFYSCAAGIVGYCRNINYRRSFVNCANFGKVSSSAKIAIATAAGISMEITQATIGNLKNFASVYANAYGNLSREFMIDQYESENCNELNTPESLSDMQAFVEANQAVEGIELNNWIENDDVVSMDNNAQVYIAPDYIDATVYIMSEIAGASNLTIISERDGNPITRTFSSKSFLIEGLKPDETYRYDISIGDKNKTGAFTTKKPSVSIESEKLNYTSAVLAVETDCPYDQIDEFGVYYRKDAPTEYRWEERACSANSVGIDGLWDNTSYLVRPFIRIKDKEFTGNGISIKTDEIKPDFVCTKKLLHSLELSCTNIDELREFQPSVLCADSLYNCDENGNIKINGLDYNSSYTCKVVYFSPECKKYGSDIVLSTLNNGTDYCLQLSPTAAMVQGIIWEYGSNAPNGKTFTNCRFEYRKIDDPVDVVSNYVDAVYIDDSKCFAATIPFDDSGIYQYRTYVDNTYDPGSRYYNKVVGDWRIAQEGNSLSYGSVVIPKFFNIKISGNVLQCQFVEGEEAIISKGLEYSVQSSDKLLRINNISLSLNLFSDQLTYTGRFFAETQSGMYYSELFQFDGGGNLIKGELSENPREEHSYLTVYCPNDGKIMLTDPGDFLLEAPKNSRFNTVLFNNKDITDWAVDNRIELMNIYGANELSYTLEVSESDVDIIDADQESVKVYSKDSNIYIEASDNSGQINIYDMKGLVIYKGFDSEIPVAANNVYIVTIGHRSFKLYVK